MQQGQEKITRLEQEKEHWLLEAQLGKVRLEKENQRISDLEAQLAMALGEGQISQTSAVSSVTQNHEEVETAQKTAAKETMCTSLVQSRFNFILQRKFLMHGRCFWDNYCLCLSLPCFF